MWSKIETDTTSAEEVLREMAPQIPGGDVIVFEEHPHFFLWETVAGRKDLPPVTGFPIEFQINTVEVVEMEPFPSGKSYVRNFFDTPNRGPICPDAAGTAPDRRCPVAFPRPDRVPGQYDNPADNADLVTRVRLVGNMKDGRRVAAFVPYKPFLYVKPNPESGAAGLAALTASRIAATLRLPESEVNVIKMMKKQYAGWHRDWDEWYLVEVPRQHFLKRLAWALGPSGPSGFNHTVEYDDVFRIKEHWKAIAHHYKEYRPNAWVRLTDGNLLARSAQEHFVDVEVWDATAECLNAELTDMPMPKCRREAAWDIETRGIKKRTGEDGVLDECSVYKLTVCVCDNTGDGYFPCVGNFVITTIDEPPHPLFTVIRVFHPVQLYVAFARLLRRFRVACRFTHNGRSFDMRMQRQQLAMWYRRASVVSWFPDHPASWMPSMEALRDRVFKLQIQDHRNRLKAEMQAQNDRAAARGTRLEKAPKAEPFGLRVYRCDHPYGVEVYEENLRVLWEAYEMQILPALDAMPTGAMDRRQLQALASAACAGAGSPRYATAAQQSATKAWVAGMWSAVASGPKTAARHMVHVARQMLGLCKWEGVADAEFLDVRSLEPSTFVFSSTESKGKGITLEAKYDVENFVYDEDTMVVALSINKNEPCGLDSVAKRLGLPQKVDLKYYDMFELVQESSAAEWGYARFYIDYEHDDCIIRRSSAERGGLRRLADLDPSTLGPEDVPRRGAMQPVTVYAMFDSVITAKITQKLGIVVDASIWAWCCYMPMRGRFVQSAVAPATMMLFAYLDKRGDKSHILGRASVPFEAESFAGGRCILTKSGFYKDSHQASLDFCSLYPSIQLYANLCFTTCIFDDRTLAQAREAGLDLLAMPLPAGPIVGYEKSNAGKTKGQMIPVREMRTYHFVQFDQNRVDEGAAQGVLAKMQGELMVLRKKIKKWMGAAQEAGDMVKAAAYDAFQNAIKLLMNGTYGAIGFVEFPFPARVLSAATTWMGRQSVSILKDMVDKEFRLDTLFTQQIGEEVVRRLEWDREYETYSLRDAICAIAGVPLDAWERPDFEMHSIGGDTDSCFETLPIKKGSLQELWLIEAHGAKVGADAAKLLKRVPRQYVETEQFLLESASGLWTPQEVSAMEDWNARRMGVQRYPWGREWHHAPAGTILALVQGLVPKSRRSPSDVLLVVRCAGPDAGPALPGGHEVLTSMAVGPGCSAVRKFFERTLEEEKLPAHVRAMKAAVEAWYARENTCQKIITQRGTCSACSFDDARGKSCASCGAVFGGKDAAAASLLDVKRNLSGLPEGALVLIEHESATRRVAFVLASFLTDFTKHFKYNQRTRDGKVPGLYLDLELDYVTEQNVMVRQKNYAAQKYEDERALESWNKEHTIKGLACVKRDTPAKLRTFMSATLKTLQDKGMQQAVTDFVRFIMNIMDMRTPLDAESWVKTKKTKHPGTVENPDAIDYLNARKHMVMCIEKGLLPPDVQVPKYGDQMKLVRVVKSKDTPKSQCYMELTTAMHLGAEIDRKYYLETTCSKWKSILWLQDLHPLKYFLEQALLLAASSCVNSMCHPMCGKNGVPSCVMCRGVEDVAAGRLIQELPTPKMVMTYDTQSFARQPQSTRKVLSVLIPDKIIEEQDDEEYDPETSTFRKIDRDVVPATGPVQMDMAQFATRLDAPPQCAKRPAPTRAAGTTGPPARRAKQAPQKSTMNNFFRKQQ